MPDLGVEPGFAAVDEDVASISVLGAEPGFTSDGIAAF
jgi:hypothetical protein